MCSVNKLKLTCRVAYVSFKRSLRLFAFNAQAIYEREDIVNLSMSFVFHKISFLVNILRISFVFPGKLTIIFKYS